MSDWLPSLNALRAFEATARLRSFTKAADELSVTPAAVKQLVGKLELAIGVPLLERRAGGMELTQVGAKGCVDLQIAFQHLFSAVKLMRSAKDSNRLVISVDPSLASSWLAPRLHGFKSVSPEVEVLVHASTDVVDLKTGFADVGIRFGVEDHGDLIAHRLFDERLVALCSPRLAEGPPAITRLEDLQHVAMLRWDLSEFEWATNTRKWNLWRTWLDAVGAGHITPGPGVKFNDYNIALQAAIAGQGMILGSLPVLKHLIDSGLLVDPFQVCATPKIGYDVVTSSEAMSRPCVTQFLAWIIQQDAPEPSVHP